MEKIRTSIKRFLVWAGWYKFVILSVKNKPGHPWDMYAVKFEINQNPNRIFFGMSYIKRTKLEAPEVVDFTNNPRNLGHRINLKPTDQDTREIILSSLERKPKKKLTTAS